MTGPGARASCLFYVIGIVVHLCLAQSVRADPADRPHRIVSMNMCTDHLALMLADRVDILSVTFSSADPGQSLITDRLTGMVLNDGQAEQVLSLHPDLVLSGVLTTAYANRLLRELGLPVVEVPFPESLADARHNIRLVARAIGVPERGERLIADLDQRVGQAVRERPAKSLSVLVLAAGGFTHGRHTIVDDLLTQAGLRNSAAELGIDHTRNIDLETVLRAAPDVIVFSRAGRLSHALATGWLALPVLKKYTQAHKAVDVPSNYLGCQTPYLGAALQMIVQGVREPGEEGAP